MTTTTTKKKKEQKLVIKRYLISFLTSQRKLIYIKKLNLTKKNILKAGNQLVVFTAVQSRPFLVNEPE